MNEPLVSVLVITYNQENTISQTIDCILQQNINFPIEIIIGEDCSKDKTREICVTYQKKYPNIIQLILHGQNQGLLKNYQSVLIACRGKYIAQCAGDDYWHHPDKLKMQVDFLESHPDYGVVHSDVNILITRTNEIKTALRANVLTGNVFRSLLLDGNHIHAPTALYRKDLLKYIDFDDYIKNAFLMEDYPMWLDLSNHTKFHWINMSLATYRQNINSASAFSDYSKKVAFFKNIFQIRNHFNSLYPGKVNQEEIDQRYFKERRTIAVKYKKYEDVKYYANKVESTTIIQKARKFIMTHKTLYHLFQQYV